MHHRAEWVALAIFILLVAVSGLLMWEVAFVVAAAAAPVAGVWWIYRYDQQRVARQALRSSQFAEMRLKIVRQDQALERLLDEMNRYPRKSRAHVGNPDLLKQLDNHLRLLDHVATLMRWGWLGKEEFPGGWEDYLRDLHDWKQLSRYVVKTRKHRFGAIMSEWLSLGLIVTEGEVVDVLGGAGEDRPGREGSRVAIGQTTPGRYLKVIYVPHPEREIVFVITAYELRGKPLMVYQRRRRRRR